MDIFVVGAPPDQNRVPFSPSGWAGSTQTPPPFQHFPPAAVPLPDWLMCSVYFTSLEKIGLAFMSLKAARTQCVRGGRICFLQENEQNMCVSFLNWLVSEQLANSACAGISKHPV